MHMKVRDGMCMEVCVCVCEHMVELSCGQQPCCVRMPINKTCVVMWLLGIIGGRGTPVATEWDTE